MHILITGGSGFVGASLARYLLDSKPFGVDQPIRQVTLIDRAPPPAALAADGRVQSVFGDLVDVLESGQFAQYWPDLVFHLAAAVSSECEADFDLGLRSNLKATQLLLEACSDQQRQTGRAPRLVFASSVAVFGGKQPAVVQDDTLPQPQSSYGIQKYICEQLLADYSRKEFVDGRSVRLMTVCVRPGQPNRAASSFLSGIVREPLAGQRAVCPVGGHTEVAIGTLASSLDGLVKAATLSAADWGSKTAMNLPALTVRVDQMVAALSKVAGDTAVNLIDWKADAVIQSIVGGWPSRIQANRAATLGLRADFDFEDVIRSYTTAHPNAVVLPVTS